ncbi:esterase/lipase family protein [Nocardia terpenica]|uniref:esterase/lipase family protein n=1 Tax=Nocardia terpenica TaxID=455432 RepID=UPI0015C56DD0|nr:alpha/beta fold hydrolase [Nocardia terpenica]NQE90375.1 alpha/beta fold hydrolase [Nocardia terpenica]
MPRRFTRRVETAAAAALLIALLGPTARAEPAPAPSLPIGIGKHPDGSTPPPGADDWNCVPSQAHPRPVVLLHGTWDNQNVWDVLAPQLKDRGYCVFSLNYGRDASSAVGVLDGMYGTGDIRASAREVAGFVERVRVATGAARVDLVGHSQGAVLARQYLRFEGGGAKVGTLVSLVGSNHGVDSVGLGRLMGGAMASIRDAALARVVGVAGTQQLTGSDFLRELNASGDTVPGVHYTVVASRVDDASQPPEATFLRPGPGATVDNVWVQDLCPADAYRHADVPRSPTVTYIVQRALDPDYSGTPCPH